MQVGFKTGPKTWEEGKIIAREDGVKLCEVWFRIDKAEEYDSMLAFLAAEKVKVGLHHWGLIDGKYKTNIASGDEHIRTQTLAQIKDTIEIGAKIECAYVNAHCGAQANEIISFEPFEQQLLSTGKIHSAEAEKIFLESAAQLQEFAQRKGVTLTIETLPGAESATSREDIYVPGNTPYLTLLQLSSIGAFMANDFTHTASQIMLATQDLSAIWNRLFEFTKTAAPITRLLHVNTVIPPFNGSDSHNGILPEDFSAGAFPTAEQIKELLRIFKDRDDVCAIPEPHTDMRKNTQALRALAQSLS